MQCLRSLGMEIVSLNKLALYSVVANAVDASFGITTLMILGHLGKGHLSAGVIAMAIYNISWYFLEGMLTAQDNLVSRAFSVKDRRSARYWSYVAGAVTVLYFIPTTVMFAFAAVIVQYAFSIRPHTAAKAAQFLILLLPGFWCHALYRVMQKYLQCQKQMRLPLVCGGIGGYVLTFALGLGFQGCGVAATCARALMLLAIFSSICKVEDITILVEEVTLLGKSIRRRYFDDTDLDSTPDEASSERRAKAPPPSALAGKRPAGKGPPRGRKVRIAPIASESQHGEDGALAASPSGGIEMVDMESRDSVTSGAPGNATGRIEESHDVQNPLSRGSVGTGVDVESGQTTVPSEEDEGEGGDDTVSLIRAAEGTQEDLQRTGKTVVADTLRFLFLGVPGGLMMGTEFWLFEVLTVTIAHMGSIAVGTNQILLTITSFFFLSLPFAVSVAGTVQISKQLGRKRHRRARMVAYVCLVEGSLLMVSAAGAMYALRDYIGYLFTGNADIIARMKVLAPFVAGFQVAYGVYGAAQGVLRATSHQLEILGWTVLAVWLIGLPISLYLAFVTRPTYGLQGLWIGMIAGTGMLAGALVLQILLLDWEKEARKAEYRLRASGGDTTEEAGRRRGLPVRLGEHDAGDELGIVMNPMGASRDLSGRRGSGGYLGPTPLPSVGSRAVGGFPLEFLFRTAEEDLAELEYVEFGATTAPTGSHRTGGAVMITEAPGEDDEQYKRAD